MFYLYFYVLAEADLQETEIEIRINIGKNTLICGELVDPDDVSSGPTDNTGNYGNNPDTSIGSYINLSYIYLIILCIIVVAVI